MSPVITCKPIGSEAVSVATAAHGLSEHNEVHMNSEIQEITDALLQEHASISPKYFYDTHGSVLFERITLLPEYYLTRTESALMQAHSEDIARCAGLGTVLIELGAGSCHKARALCRIIKPSEYVAVDIAANFLNQSIQPLKAEFESMRVRTVVADISKAFDLPKELERENRLIFYPGSSIGNFDRPGAGAMLSRMRGMLHGDAGVLIGFDLPKDPGVLQAAYDDAQGVTAAFNLNILTHINRLIGSNFELQAWRHVAFFNPVESRIEMHLEAVTDVSVRWPAGGRDFRAGARIHTENSYKYSIDAFASLLDNAGFSRKTYWRDPQDWFCVVLARP